MNSNAPAVPAWPGLPQGRQNWEGIPFRIDGRLPVTGLDDARDGDFYPPRLRAIPVGRRAARLHLLHSAGHDEKDGVPLAKLILRYADGGEHAVRLAYGVHVRSWMAGRTEVKTNLFDPASRLAWSGEAEDSERAGATLRLFHTAIVNPRPQAEIREVELVSLFSRATPFLAALTTEDADGVGPEFRPSAPRRVEKKSVELEDAVYHAEFVIHAKDADGGQPLPNVHAALTISDDEATYYFGEARSDAAGIIRLPYPPQHTVAYALLVRAPGRVPQLFSGSITNGGTIAREREARLARGVRIGGIVTDPGGAPIAGAEVVIHQIVRHGPREFTRIDHETVRTAADGKWFSEAVPAGFEGFSFHVLHPERRPMTFVQAPANAATGGLTREDLLAGRAVMVLPPALKVSGVVVNFAGKPLPEAEVQLVDGESARPARALTLDAEGRFSLVLAQPGEVSLLVRAKGYKPKLQSLPAGPDALPMKITLARAEPFRGRVVDQNRQPVPGARLRLDSWNGQRLLQWQTLTDGNGGFVWDSPPEGSLMLQVSATNHSSTRMSLSNPSGEQMITIYKYSRVSGRVVDAETGKPIDEFMVIKGRAYNEDEPIRWERYDAVRGRKGEFSARLNDYSSSGRSQILVEAPGYLPAVSPPFARAGIYTNHFALKKGRGISGVVQHPDGTPATNVMLALVERSDNAYMEKPGELRRSGSGGEFQRSNLRGQFEFPPKYEPHTILAASEAGFAEVRTTNVVATGRIVLQPWGRIRGQLRVGKGIEPGQKVVLQGSDWRYGEEGRNGPPLYISVPAELDAQGNFVMEKVPPGERKVSLQFRINERENARVASSHGVPVSVKPGETAEVVVGGGGRTVVGRMNVAGGDPGDVDWRRDVHSLQSQLSIPVNIPPPELRPDMSSEERQKAYREYNERQAAFWRTDEGRALQRKQRYYALRFETNGTFRVDNVEPGTYMLYVSLTNPDRPDNYYEHIGSMNKTVTIPPAPEGKPSEPFDLGKHEVTVRGLQRTGRPAPKFELKTVDGRTVRLDDFKGRYVLLDFWATWAGTRSLDVQMLKALHEAYGKDERFVLLGVNFDNDLKTAQEAITKNGFNWMQSHAGPINDSGLSTAYGIQGLPDNVLIDPEGKIRSRNLRGSNIRSTVRNLLGDPAPPKAP